MSPPPRSSRWCRRPDLLPAPVAARGKTGFGVPLARWFRAELRPVVHDLVLGPRALDRGWFRRETLERLVAEHESGIADHGHRLWCLVMLELWIRTHVEAERPVLVA